MKKNLVISIFNHNPDWIKFLNDDIKIFLYRKGGEKQRSDEIILEPNVGRDVHTFFKHICLNYESLSDITFFCQDYPFDHWENALETLNGDLNTINKNAASFKTTFGTTAPKYMGRSETPYFLKSKYQVCVPPKVNGRQLNC